MEKQFLESYKEMKVGDLITTYHAGVHRLKKIERRILSKEDKERHPHAYKDIEAESDMSPLFHYVQVADVNGQKKIGKTTKKCDAFFCKPFILMVEDLRHKLGDLEALLEC